MKKPSRFLRILGTLGLLSTLIAAAVGTAAPAGAQEVELPIPFDPDYIFDFDNPDFEPGTNVIYFPWVANDDESAGLGPADTSITVQNLSYSSVQSNEGAQIYIFKGSGDGSWEYVTSAGLAPGASKTFTAADLDIEEGAGAPVAVVGLAQFEYEIDEDDDAWDDYFGANVVELKEAPVTLSKPVGVEGDQTQVTVCLAYAVVTEDEESDEEFTVPAPFAATIDLSETVAPDGVAHTAYQAGDFPDNYPSDDSFVAWETQQELQDLLNAVNLLGGQLVNPFGGLNADGDCDDTLKVEEDGTAVYTNTVPLGGVAKQAVDGESLPYTTGADASVSGYNAVNQLEVNSFDQWYQPIVQTNCGPGGCWNTILRIANLGNLNNAVTVSFFPADDGSGSLQPGFQLQNLIDGGDVWHIDLSNWVPEGWVGSAHIYSDGAVFTMADRVKVGYSMWITNTGSSADFEHSDAGWIDGICGCAPGGGYNYVLFAPDVRLDFYGWNTGINVANLANTDNNISIQYFNHLGNATEVLNQRLAPQGMTYYYDPSQAPQDNSQQDPTQDVNADIVGSAIIWSEFPVAAAVDATKYPESTTEADANVFQGFSYSATRNAYPWQAVPLVQKGNPADGMGATSGINIMNLAAAPNSIDVYWINPSGFGATNFGVSRVQIPANANGFVYSMTQHNLPAGYYGSAVVEAEYPIVATSAQVDYQVEWDGTAVWNAFNPCGFFRAVGDEGCQYAPSDDGEPHANSTIEKTFVDEEGNPVPGVQTILYDETAFNAIGDEDGEDEDLGTTYTGTSDEDGEVDFNVPAGTYYLTVTEVLGNTDLSNQFELDEDSVDPGEEVEVIEVNGVQYEVITVDENEFVGVTNILLPVIIERGVLNKYVCGIQPLSGSVPVGVAEEGCFEAEALEDATVSVYQFAEGEDPDAFDSEDLSTYPSSYPDDPYRQRSTNADGLASFVLAPGTYLVCASRLDEGAPFYGEHCEVVTVVVDETTTVYNYLEPYGIIDGEIRFENCEPSEPQQQLPTSCPLPGATVVLRIGGVVVDTQISDANGQFEFDGDSDDDGVQDYVIEDGTEYSVSASLLGAEIGQAVDLEYCFFDGSNKCDLEPDDFIDDEVVDGEGTYDVQIALDVSDFASAGLFFVDGWVDCDGSGFGDSPVNAVGESDVCGSDGTVTISQVEFYDSTGTTLLYTAQFSTFGSVLVSVSNIGGAGTYDLVATYELSNGMTYTGSLDDQTIAGGEVFSIDLLTAAP